MKPLTQYGLMAERHWREFLPKLVAELEAKGRLHQMLLEAYFAMEVTPAVQNA